MSVVSQYEAAHDGVVMTNDEYKVLRWIVYRQVHKAHGRQRAEAVSRMMKRHHDTAKVIAQAVRRDRWEQQQLDMPAEV